MAIEELLSISHKYGNNPEFVLAGGGNTSYKDGDVMYIKGSGVSLGAIREDQFVKMDRPSLTHLWSKRYPNDEKAREAAVLNDLMAARLPGEENKRPSVETLLHHLLPQPLILHVHPALINGLCCSQMGERAMHMLFNEAVFVPSTKPGYILAVRCRQLVDRYINRYARYPRILFLQNHGVFFAGENEEEIDKLVSMTVRRLQGIQTRLPDFSPVEYDKERVASVMPALRMLYGGVKAKVRFTVNAEIARFCESKESFAPLVKPFTPDQIVYCKAEPLYVCAKEGEDILPVLKAEFERYTAANGYPPKVVAIEKLGMFTCGKTVKEAETAAVVFSDAAAITVYTEAFGGPLPMDADLVDFIIHWEAESYRAGVHAGASESARIAGKIALICHPAVRYGEDLAKRLCADGAYVLIAEEDEMAAQKLYDRLTAAYGDCCAVISNDLSGKGAIRHTVADSILHSGGLDLVVWFFGKLRGDERPEAEEAAYRYLANCAGEKMAIEHFADPSYRTDIIDIGNENPSLRQTASSLLSRGVKVNSIRPTKQPNPPMGRPCRSDDLALALYYLTEQQFETGLCLPVTGGEGLR